MIPIVIIGAGMAGLACARRLADAGLDPVLLDKGRGVGGRLATRRMGDMQFDHGAQYVTAQGSGFAAVLEALGTAGALADWQDGSGRKHSVGSPGMSAFPKALATGLKIRQGTQVLELIKENEGWLLRLTDGVLRSRCVVATVPAPQVAALLGSDHPLVAALEPVRMAPCLTLMAAVDAPAPFVAQRDPEDALAWIAHDNSKPGRPQDTATLWVAQANEAFSQAHLEQDTPALVGEMLPLLCDRLGVAQSRVTQAVGHRWRYARVTQALGQPFLRSPDAGVYLGGDWCLGPRIEAAWQSGTAIADDILARG